MPCSRLDLWPTRRSQRSVSNRTQSACFGPQQHPKRPSCDPLSSQMRVDRPSFPLGCGFIHSLSPSPPQPPSFPTSQAQLRCAAIHSSLSTLRSPQESLTKIARRAGDFIHKKQDHVQTRLQKPQTILKRDSSAESNGSPNGSRENILQRLASPGTPQGLSVRIEEPVWRYLQVSALSSDDDNPHFMTLSVSHPPKS